MPPKKGRPTIRPATPVIAVPASPPYRSAPTSPSQIVKRMFGDNAIIEYAKQYATDLLRQHHDADRNSLQQRHDKQIDNLTKTLKIAGQHRKNEIVQLAHEEDIALTKELEDNLEWERNMKHAALAVIVVLVFFCGYLEFYGNQSSQSSRTQVRRY